MVFHISGCFKHCLLLWFWTLVFPSLKKKPLENVLADLLIGRRRKGGNTGYQWGWQCFTVVKASCCCYILNANLGYCTRILFYLNPSPEILKSPKSVSHQVSPSQQSHLPWCLCTKAFPLMISLLQYYWCIFFSRSPQSCWDYISKLSPPLCPGYSSVSFLFLSTFKSFSTCTFTPLTSLPIRSLHVCRNNYWQVHFCF